MVPGIVGEEEQVHSRGIDAVLSDPLTHPDDPIELYCVRVHVSPLGVLDVVGGSDNANVGLPLYKHKRCFSIVSITSAYT